MPHAARPDANEPAFYILDEVRCPGTYTTHGTDVPCGAMWDRREKDKDRAVHEVSCWKCGNLITYRLGDKGAIVVISIQRKKGSPTA
jgi:hypothetical protein